MNMKMEYLINSLKLSRKIAFNLNFYINNKCYDLGVNYILNLDIDNEIKAKLTKAFLSYKLCC